tara:strand:- start:40 stop:273 length:234 start_codon:yes stop_codon:yes gene_type:complete
MKNKNNDMKNKTDKVWAVMCPAWGTVISLYSTKELADISASIMSAETDTLHDVKEFEIFSSLEPKVALGETQLELDV